MSVRRGCQPPIHRSTENVTTKPPPEQHSRPPSRHHREHFECHHKVAVGRLMLQASTISIWCMHETSMGVDEGLTPQLAQPHDPQFPEQPHEEQEQGDILID